MILEIDCKSMTQLSASNSPEVGVGGGQAGIINIVQSKSYKENSTVTFISEARLA